MIQWKWLFTFAISFWLGFGGIVGYGFSGCSPELEEKPAQLGPETGVESINKAIIEASGNQNAQSVRMGEYAAYQENYRVGTGAVILMQETELTVIAIDEQDGVKTATWKEVTYDYSSKEMREIVREGSDQWTLDVQTMLQPQALNMLSQDLNSQSTQYEKITFHAFEKEVVRESPPLGTRGQSQCGGLGKCQIEVHRLKFDMVGWRNGSEYDKVTYKLELSPDLPYYSYPLSQCTRENITYEGDKFLFTQCRVLKDFAFGSVE